MRIRLAIIAIPLLLCMTAANGLSQNFSRGIAATYRIASNVTYVKSGA
jgi:hypothetical protein